MQIKYKNKALQKICTNAYSAQKKYGNRMALIIHQRIDELSAAESIEEMIKYGIGRCHPLHGNRKGQYALDLINPHRLVFAKVNGEIKIVCVIEIVDDYH